MAAAGSATRRRVPSRMLIVRGSLCIRGRGLGRGGMARPRGRWGELRGEGLRWQIGWIGDEGIVVVVSVK